MSNDTDSRDIRPNNGRAPKTLTGCLALACAVLEGIQNDHPGALAMGLIGDAKNFCMDALTQNEHEEAEMRLAGLPLTSHERLGISDVNA